MGFLGFNLGQERSKFTLRVYVMWLTKVWQHITSMGVRYAGLLSKKDDSGVCHFNDGFRYGRIG